MGPIINYLGKKNGRKDFSLGPMVFEEAGILEG